MTADRHRHWGRPGGRGWLLAGRCSAATGWALWVLVQVVAADPFPPEISLSQYGLGPAGWLFSIWAITTGLAPLLLHWYQPGRGPGAVLLGLAFAGSLVTAVVRTDEDGLQQSLHARVHTAGAIAALVLLPAGILVGLRHATRNWRRLSVILVAGSVVVGVLVLVSAAGIDTAGMGPARSWAFWEGSLCVLELVVVSVYAVAVATIEPPPARLGGGAPVQSALR